MIKKYGVKYTAQSPELFEKMKNSNIKKYGVENPLSNKNINNKCKQTLLVLPLFLLYPMLFLEKLASNS